MYTIKRGWIDAYGKTRTWRLLDGEGRAVAEITTRRAAQQLADLLNTKPA